MASMTTLQPDSTITIPGQVTVPEMDYEVRENGNEWVRVGQGSECNGGYLRYIKDGFAKSAAPGDWRGILTDEYAAQVAKFDEFKMEVAKKEVNKRVWAGAFFVILIIMFIILAFAG